MAWGLFIQIEVIILTIGLVASFVISVKQNVKDNSFFKRIAAIGEVLGKWGKDMIDNQKKEEK